MTPHQLAQRTACRFCGAPGYCVHGDPRATGIGRIPDDPHVLRIVAALAELWVPDHSGGTRLWTYTGREIAEALHFLAAAHRDELYAACARAEWHNGAPGPCVIPFTPREVIE